MLLYVKKSDTKEAGDLAPAVLSRDSGGLKPPPLLLLCNF
jgi:hypothetical protein